MATLAAMTKDEKVTRAETIGILIPNFFWHFWRTDMSSFFRWLAFRGLKMSGWKLVGTIPPINKFLLIGAPHTSNWDFLFGMVAQLLLSVRFYWIGKDTLFKWYTSPILHWLGGIPVDRSKSHNTVEQMVEFYNKSEHLVVAMSPEGTRKKTDYWRGGFYHIAIGAKIPVVCAFIDYGKKTFGIGPTIFLSGDVEADMDKIRSFYKDITPKYPGQESDMRIRS